MQRRSFLQRLAMGVATVGGASAPFGLARIMTPEAAATPQTHLRPPGALTDDAAFIEACIGCSLCGEVCPVGAIRFYGREGGKKANTPYINPEIKACTLSGHCMEICPTEALTVVKKQDIAMGYAQIDRTACYPWVDQGVCGVCATACPLGESAIGFAFANFYRPVIKKGCVGCGVCVEVCPQPSLPIRIVARSLVNGAGYKTHPIPERIVQGAPKLKSICPPNVAVTPESPSTQKVPIDGLLPF